MLPKNSVSLLIALSAFGMMISILAIYGSIKIRAGYKYFAWLLAAGIATYLISVN